MAKFDDFWEALRAGLEELIKTTLKGFARQAKADSTAFLKKAKQDLQRWTKLLAGEQLTKEEFEWLVLGKKDLAEMEALKQAGLALIRIERFQYAVLDLIINTAFKSFA